MEHWDNILRFSLSKTSKITKSDTTFQKESCTNGNYSKQEPTLLKVHYKENTLE